MRAEIIREPEEIHVSRRQRWRRNDTELLNRYLSGDTAALSTLYARYYRLVYSIAIGVLGHHDNARENSQEVFMTVIQQLSNVGERLTDLRAWVISASREAATDLARSLGRPMSGKSCGSSIHDRFATLTEQQRIALLLREIADSKTDEIAAALGIDKPSVVRLIQDARLSLRGAADSTVKSLI